MSTIQKKLASPPAVAKQGGDQSLSRSAFNASHAPQIDLDGLTDPTRLQQELANCTGLRAGVVAERWLEEVRLPGFNTVRDLRRFGVQAHVHDEAMARACVEAEGLIFSALVDWITPARQLERRHGLAYLQAECRRRRIEPDLLRVLVSGDLTGSDTLLLVSAGFRPYHVGMPGCVGAAFARARFTSRGLTRRHVRVVEHEDAVPEGRFDAVWSFDQLQRMPDVSRSVERLARLLDANGIAVIAEACRHVRADMPLHLEANARFAFRVPRLFRACGMVLADFPKHTDYRPCLYRKPPEPSVLQWGRCMLLAHAVRRGWWH